MKSNGLKRKGFSTDKLEELQNALLLLEELDPDEELIAYLGFDSDFAFKELQEDLYGTESNIIVDKLIDVIRNVIRVIKEAKDDREAKQLLQHMSVPSFTSLLRSRLKKKTNISKKSTKIRQTSLHLKKEELMVLQLRKEKRFEEVNMHKLNYNMVCDMEKNRKQGQVRRLSEVLRNIKV